MSLGVERDRTTAQLRAFAHPVRLRIMSLLTGAPMTAAEVARELSLTHANASYHLRQLHAAGAIVVAGEERIRGGMAKRYRYNLEHKPENSTDPGRHLAQRRVAYGAMASELRRRAKLLRHNPGGNHFTDAELWVAPETWDEIKAQVTVASDVLHRAARPPRTAGTIRVNATLALFEMEPDA